MAHLRGQIAHLRGRIAHLRRANCSHTQLRQLADFAPTCVPQRRIIIILPSSFFLLQALTGYITI